MRKRAPARALLPDHHRLHVAREPRARLRRRGEPGREPKQADGEAGRARAGGPLAEDAGGLHDRRQRVAALVRVVVDRDLPAVDRRPIRARVVAGVATGGPPGPAYAASSARATAAAAASASATAAPGSAAACPSACSASTFACDGRPAASAASSTGTAACPACARPYAADRRTHS